MYERQIDEAERHLSSLKAPEASLSVADLLFQKTPKVKCKNMVRERIDNMVGRIVGYADVLQTWVGCVACKP